MTPGAKTEALRGRNPFHWGEVDAQIRMGHTDIADWARRSIRTAMPGQHRQFFESQPFLIAAARDPAGKPWATVLTGEEGFVAAPDPASLRLAARPVPGDALEGSFQVGADVGLLGIEFATRRRNRVNGRIVSIGGDDDGGALQFAVSQSFGNCPQHIPERLLSRAAGTPGPVRHGARLKAADKALIQTATSFFIASGHAGEGEASGLDASHRGGPAGFVVVDGDRRMTFPDFGGNRFMNTVGNLLTDPRIGLLFVDFATGGMLQVSGRATIIWDGADLRAHPGAERLIQIEVEAVRALPAALPLRWRPAADAALSLQVASRVQETPDIVSFHLAAADGAVLPSFKPGQHLPLLLEIPDAGRIERTYTISGRGDAGGYRITVKRADHGIASNWLHDHALEGARLEARPPAGAFGPATGDGPLVLVSAGVGATPMAALLEGLAALNSERPIWRLHGARDAGNDLFASESWRHGAALASFEMRTFYSRARPDHAHAHAVAGRLTPAAVKAYIGDTRADVMLCGPTAFVARMEAGLVDEGFDPERITSESFG